MARYTGWRRLSGDTAARPDLLDLGKLLLGELETQRRLSGLKTLVRRRQTPDGSIVEARFDGDIPSIHVRAARPRPPGGQPPRVFVPSGFVVTARDDAHPTGIDAEHPQQILQYRLEDGIWRTYFYSPDIDGFNGFAGEKGVYNNRFPDGLQEAGNLDWIGTKPEDGTDADRIRLNYYGPRRRYWYDGWRRPGAQYGHWVFLNGQVLLDIDEVNTEREAAVLATFAETYVMGCAYAGGWLYVMQGRINDFGSEANTIPDRTGFPAGEAAGLTPPYPDGDSDLRLVRYPVTMQPPPREGLPPTYRVSAENAESLWTRTGRGLVNPWVFAPDASAAETFAMPDELRYQRWNSSIDAAPPVVTEILPSTSSEHVQLAIADGIATESVEALSVLFQLGRTYPFGTPLGLQHQVSAVVAADYSPDGVRRELIYTAKFYNSTSDPEDHKFMFDTVRVDDGPEVTLYDENQPGDSSDRRTQLFAIAVIDIRFGVVALDGYEGATLQLNDARYLTRTYVEGVLVATEELESLFRMGPILFSAWINTTTQAQLVNVSPLFVLAGIRSVHGYSESAGNSSGTTDISTRFGGQFPVNVPAGEREGMVRRGSVSLAFQYVSQTFPMDGGDAPLSLEPADTRGYKLPASLACNSTHQLASFNGFTTKFQSSSVSFNQPHFFGLWGASESLRAELLPYDPAVFLTVNRASDEALPDLTGVAADGARYAPIWLLGAYPQPS